MSASYLIKFICILLLVTTCSPSLSCLDTFCFQPRQSMHDWPTLVCLWTKSVIIPPLYLPDAVFFRAKQVMEDPEMVYVSIFWSQSSSTTMKGGQETLSTSKKNSVPLTADWDVGWGYFTGKGTMLQSVVSHGGRGELLDSEGRSQPPPAVVFRSLWLGLIEPGLSYDCSNRISTEGVPQKDVECQSGCAQYKQNMASLFYRSWKKSSHPLLVVVVGPGQPVLAGTELCQWQQPEQETEPYWKSVSDPISLGLYFYLFSSMVSAEAPFTSLLCRLVFWPGSSSPLRSPYVVFILMHRPNVLFSYYWKWNIRVGVIG